MPICTLLAHFGFPAAHGGGCEREVRMMALNMLVVECEMFAAHTNNPHGRSILRCAVERAAKIGLT